MKITEAIAGEHAAMRPMLRHLREATAPGRRVDPAMIRASAHMLNISLKAHAGVEEPLLLKPLKDKGDKAAKHAIAEHKEITDKLNDAIRTGNQATLNYAVRLVLGHFDEEERDVFPAAEKLLGNTRLSELGAKYLVVRGVKL